MYGRQTLIQNIFLYFEEVIALVRTCSEARYRKKESETEKEKEKRKEEETERKLMMSLLVRTKIRVIRSDYQKRL